ncbi:MAG: LAGLIDADG family homing endonuclease, partial [Nanoarchaeota archaeon]|nr:LAGLIDADG family homing endonuclease [Nanoarchaeota archaeon]
YKSTHVTPTVYYRLLKGKGSHVKNYYAILTFLNLDLKEAEKEIIGLTYNGSKKVYPFIKHFNPLLFRIVCHIIGDGTIASRRGDTCRWIQHKNNSSWLVELIGKQLGIIPGRTVHSKTCEAITIPSYFAMLIKNILGFEVDALKSARIIQKFIAYPKEYKLQFLAAFIVDEGHIRYKNARSLVISQTDKAMMQAISDLLDSLGYIHSKIYKEISKYYLEKGSVKTIFRMNIYSPGVYFFSKHIQKMIKKYGVYAGLWHKQECLDNYISSLRTDQKKLSKIIKVNNLINTFLKTKTCITYKELRENPLIKNELKDLSVRYLINKFYELAKQGKVRRLSKGCYKIQKF